MIQRLAKLSPSLLACSTLLVGACSTREINIRELRVELMDPYAPAPARVVGQVSVPGALGGGSLSASLTFGDGSDSVDVDLDSEGHFTANHTFHSVGNFDVLVEAKTGNTAKGSASVQAAILAPVSNIQVSCRACDNQGVCQSAPDCHVPGPSVTMEVTSQGGYNATKYTWDFGDVTPPTIGPAVTHYYRASGTYHVTVVASDTLASQVALTKDIVVDGVTPVVVTAETAFAEDMNGVPQDRAPTDVAQLYIVASGVPPITLLVTWGDESNNVYASYPGDGSTFIGTHTYLTRGTYDAVVTAVDHLGNQSSDTRQFVVR